MVYSSLNKVCGLSLPISSWTATRNNKDSISGSKEFVEVCSSACSARRHIHRNQIVGTLIYLCLYHKWHISLLASSLSNSYGCWDGSVYRVATKDLKRGIFPLVWATAQNFSLITGSWAFFLNVFPEKSEIGPSMRSCNPAWHLEMEGLEKLLHLMSSQLRQIIHRSVQFHMDRAAHQIFSYRVIEALYRSLL